MHSSSTLLTVAFSALALAAPLDPRSVNGTQGQKIHWHSCGLKSTDPAQNITAPILCGTLDVPLDYKNPSSNHTIQLDLMKVPAATNCSKGTIFTNDGGPGIDNTVFLKGEGVRLRTITGGEYDILSWHPRGTNGTLLFSCFANATARLAAYSQFPSVAGAIRGNSSDAALGQIWAESGLFADACYEAQDATGSLIGTSYSARDMMQIVDALGEDGLLRYWGFSYGTILGATAAAMFPDRIDKLVLDGVVNPREYYTNAAYVSSPESADDTFAGFFKGCVADPGRCTLGKNRTAEQLETLVYNFLDDLKYNPIVLESPPLLVTYAQVKATIYNTLYNPSTWASFSDDLYGIVTRNSTLIGAMLARDANVTGPPESDAESNQGIRCSDLVTRYSSLEGLRPSLEAAHKSSRIAGDYNDNVAAECAQWKFAAKERYTGDFQVKTKKPALFIGNTYDPATSFASARNASSGFEGSALLQQNGYGHASIAQASLCTAKAIRAYFADGNLPSPGTVCQVDQPILTDDSNVDWAKVLKQLS